MSRRTPWTAEEWAAEVAYVCAVMDRSEEERRQGRTGDRALGSFRNDVTCFARYVAMQRDLAESDGVHDAATTLQHVIDDLRLTPEGD